MGGAAEAKVASTSQMTAYPNTSRQVFEPAAEPIDYRTYDDLLQALQSASRDVSKVSDFLTRLGRTFGGVATLSVFDYTGDLTVAAVSSRYLPVDEEAMKRWVSDPGARAVARIRHPRARRLSEVVPWGLEREPWFKGLYLDYGVRHALMQDLGRQVGRVRLHVTTRREMGDFGGDSVELFERVARHATVMLGDLDLHNVGRVRFGPEICVLQVGRREEGELPLLSLGLCSLYGLSAAEAKVAVAVGAGRSPAQAALALGVSINTVRSHLKNIYLKLEINRLAELVSVLSSMPGFREACRSTAALQQSLA
jgi:DNA-binding CsgD family transcriptional regulator